MSSEKSKALRDAKLSDDEGFFDDLPDDSQAADNGEDFFNDAELIEIRFKDSLSPVEFWRGPEKSQLAKRIAESRYHKLFIDLVHIRGMDGGCWSILVDAAQAGKRIILLNPRPEVQNFSWFRIATRPLTSSAFLVTPELVVPDLQRNALLAVRDSKTKNVFEEGIESAEDSGENINDWYARYRIAEDTMVTKQAAKSALVDFAEDEQLDEESEVA
ncbi:hypothetical protein EXS65_02940 [Candidatus Peribacteria bacterium]|nr:hypothetical protein [Candidatus Peribacteria bacterium]